MKRSEMIKIVQDAIYQAITVIDIIVHEEEASDILKRLEEAGMLPPETDNEEGAIISVPVYDDGMIVDRVRHGWDKE